MRTILLIGDERAKRPLFAQTVATALLPIANRPVMERVIEHLARASLKDVVVSLCQASGPIVAYFGGGQRWGVTITYINQSGQGAGSVLDWAAHSLQDTFLILPGDSVIDLDIAAAIAFHRAHGTGATAIVKPACRRATSSPIVLDERGRMIGVSAQPGAGEVCAHTGAYLFDAGVLQSIRPRHPADLERQLLPGLIVDGVVVYGYLMCGYWNPLETAGDFQEAQEVFLFSAWAAQPDAELGAAVRHVSYASIPGRQIAPGIWAAQHAAIHPSARLTAPLCLGDNCWVGPEAELGPTVVCGNNVFIDTATTIRNSTILENTYVGQRMCIEDQIGAGNLLVDLQSASCTHVADPLLLAPLGTGFGLLPRLRPLVQAIVALLLLLTALPVLLLLGLLVVVTSGVSSVRDDAPGNRI